MKRLVGTFLAIVFSASFFIFAQTAALGYGGIGGRPAYTDPSNPRTQSIFIFSLRPGQSGSNAVEVINNTNTSQVISVDAVDSELATEGQFTCKQAVEPKTDVGAWIKLSSDSVSVPAYSHKYVAFTITVPNSNKINVGEHDGCITLEAASQTASPSTKNGVVLSFRTAIRVVVTIPGKLVKKLSINSLSVASNTNGTYQVTPTIQNEGNVSLDADLHLKLVSVFGFSTTTLKEGRMPVLPNSSESASYDLSHPFWGGFYVARATVSYNDNPSTGLGIQSNANLKVLSKDSSLFLVTPQPLAAVIEVIIVLAIVVIIIWAFRRLANKRNVKSNWVKYTVKSGDTLTHLAEHTGTSWKIIASANNIKPPYTLTESQIIKLPPKHKE